MTSTVPQPDDTVPGRTPAWADTVATVARRRRIAAALEQTAPLSLSGAAALATAALLHYLGLRGLGVAFFVVVGLAFVLFVLARWLVAAARRTDDAMRGASSVDAERQLDDTLKSALRPPSGNWRNRREEVFRALLDDRASAAAAQIDPGSFAPLRLSPLHPLSVAVIAGAGVLFQLADSAALSDSDLQLAAVSDHAEEPDSDPLDPAATSEAVETEELLRLTPEQLEQLRLRRGDAADLEGVELTEMSTEELASLLEQLGADVEFGEAGEVPDQATTAGAADPQAAEQQLEDGLEELQRRTTENPFANPEANPGQPQAQQSPSGDEGDGNALAPGEQAQSDQVQKIELPPMPNPRARPAEGGDPSAAVAVAGSESSDEMAVPPDSQQAGAGGGESSGPQAGQQNPFGEATELAVTLELALLQAEEQEERPVDRQIRHRASEAQEAKTSRRGIDRVVAGQDDLSVAGAVLSPSERRRVERYFDPEVWPQDPP